MSQDPIKGSIASRYSFIRPLGKGTGGAVVLARDTFGGENQLVAIKMLEPGAAGGVEGQMILREFDILSQLRHPNLVAVRDFGPLENGGLFLAEEYIEGFSLQDARIGSDEEFNSIVLEILSALAHLHEIGVVHRDIKPANIMVLRLDDPQAPPHAMLVDFGLSSSDPSRDRLWGGTRFFMAPEVRRRESATPKSDLFSLGVSLYYLLCGVQPIPDSEDEEVTVIAPHVLNPKVSLPFSRFIMALLRQVDGLDVKDASEAMAIFYNDVITKQFQTFLDGGVDPVFSAKVYAKFENHFLQRIYIRTARRIIKLQEDENNPLKCLLLYSPRIEEAERVAQTVQNHHKRHKSFTVELNPRTANLEVSWILKLLESISEVSASFNMEIGETYKWNYQILKAYSVLYGNFAVHELGEAFENGLELPPFDTEHYLAWFESQFEFINSLCSDSYTYYLFRNIDKMIVEEPNIKVRVLRFLNMLPPGSVILTASEDEDAIALCESEQIPAFPANFFKLKDFYHFLGAVFDEDSISELELEPALEASHFDARYVGETPFDLELYGFGSRKRAQLNNGTANLKEYKAPESLSQLYRRRFLEMSQDEKRVLEVLAVLETEIDWVVLREILNEGEIPVPKIDLAIESLIYRNIINYEVSNVVRFVKLPQKELRAVVLAPLSRARINILQQRVCEVMQEMWFEDRVTSRNLAKQFDALGDHKSASDYWLFAGEREQSAKSLEPTALLASCTAYSYAVRRMEKVEKKFSPEEIVIRRCEFAKSLMICAQTNSARREAEAAWKTVQPLPNFWLKYRVIVVGLSLARLCGSSEQFDVWEDRAAREIPNFMEATEANLLFAWRDLLIGSLKAAKTRLDRELVRARHFNDHALEAYVLSELGRFWEEVDDIPKAVQNYRASIRTARENKVQRSSVLAYIGYGRMQGALGSKEQAISSLVIGFRHSVQKGRVDLAADTLFNIAVVYLRAEVWDEASRFADHLYFLANRLNHPEHILKAQFLFACLRESIGFDEEQQSEVTEEIYEVANVAMKPSFESNIHLGFRRDCLNMAHSHADSIRDADMANRFLEGLDEISSHISKSYTNE